MPLNSFYWSKYLHHQNPSNDIIAIQLAVYSGKNHSIISLDATGKQVAETTLYHGAPSPIWMRQLFIMGSTLFK